MTLMTKPQIKQLIENRIHADGLMETGISGVRLFRATAAIPCAPAVYEPSVIAIVSGTKEAVLDGERYVYDDSRYMCCPMSMPVTAGTPDAAPDRPLYGVYLSLDQRIMTELILEMDSAGGLPSGRGAPGKQGVWLARWDETFCDALLRLLQLGESQTDTAVLGAARLREVYYAILKGEAGPLARQAFGPGNAIARSIAHLSSNLDTPISIEDMAARAGMSRAVFHRKFKQATTMSPIQFVKSMRLNNAAMKIAGGVTVTEAALNVGYVSPSQFSREFKRMYGQSPRQWSDAQHHAVGLA
ncbi:AraC family transcriptional regulator [Phaeobacter sp. J2-8]|uniref:AraC family transcriptional regulator n=1 Tax=Phaeobacter sp. J2-8 TaxID=2931394 RepID=UPI001FD07F87|nr:AraC family transcriptional regulator [Phaeobacter sp. J2-8]MCJ7871332.1 AraC family transcriptional regulator [Phaeobacter sp. J2-8]